MPTSDFLDMPQEERLRHVQSILAQYHAPRERSPYLEAYKEAEAGYWYPLLSVLDAALRSGNKKVLDIGTAYGTLLLYSVLWGNEGFGIDMRHYTPNHRWPDVFDLPYYQEGDAFVDAECKYYTIDELVALSLHTGFAIQFLQLYQGHLLAGLVK
ncbi:hypothetical protein [Paenibacillus elgii]|uniref:hypothetical protein n=1 Tax=Paenibacillus elgii TaxID=189691 RepID=UPI00203BE74E|nr:hypothetical protein [Paenibacillus elgii]MCM3268966.1 hypothetical protein [Paenibacillus elgii]